MPASGPSERANLLPHSLKSNNVRYGSLPHLDTPQTTTKRKRAYLSTPNSPVDEHHPPRRPFNLWRRRSGLYDDNTQDIVNESTGVRLWYENYSSIDWIHDYIKERVRLRKLRAKKGVRGRLMNLWDASQAWILVFIIGVITACIAAAVNIVQEWASDLKEGYCRTSWQWNRQFCCWARAEHEPCPEWVPWSETAKPTLAEASEEYFFGLLMYLGWGLLFAVIAALLVKYSAEVFTIRSTVPNIRNEKKILYFAAGSGIPEVKSILGGFVIRGFLGFKTLAVKSVGLTLACSSGLNCGKEGPFVHIASCVGNICCRLFQKFNKNEGKRREIISAAAAAGVAVAFAAPVGGVLFSLEEVSYYFPSKTMIRSYFCALTASITMQLINPFKTGKIVMFQVTYDKDYHIFELLPFMLCGLFGGIFGAAFNTLNIRWQRIRKTTVLGRYPVLDVTFVIIITVLVSYWDVYARMGLSEFVADLFAECSDKNDNGGLCITSASMVPELVRLLGTTLFVKFALTVVTFGLRVPAGIFLPSLAIGAIFGRIVGLTMQYLTMSYPEFPLFDACLPGAASSGRCIIPGVYATVGAAAGLAGVTRSTVSLVVIMFELTGTLKYALPIMAAVMISKWTADAFAPYGGIYDMIIELQGYPYLDKGKDYLEVTSIGNMVEQLDVIDINEDNTVAALRAKLDHMRSIGYAEDGGLPIVDENNVLVGYIACTELEHAVNQVCRRIELEEGDKWSIMQGNGGDSQIRDACENRHCSFKRSFGSASLDQSDISEHLTEYPVTMLTDFSQYVDQAPLTVNELASMELVLELFVKMGVRYVCVTNAEGRYSGVIHKRRLLAYLNDAEEEEEVEACRVLMVGAGGIGCELLKNLVMSGFKYIDVVDLDTIDLSNLNRQFLFQKHHIKKSKAHVARETALNFNPKAQIISHHANIKDAQFNVDWFRSFDIVLNALDNLDARRHVNKMCLIANVPLVESGTTGYLGQAYMIKKNVSECFDCQPKPVPTTYPICTIRSTPSAPIHCIVWAKSWLFGQLFGDPDDEEDDAELAKETTEENAKEIESLKQESREIKAIRDAMHTPDYPRKVFEKVFCDDIERLLRASDVWKRRTPPKPLAYDPLLQELADAQSSSNPGHSVHGLKDQRQLSLLDCFKLFLRSVEKLSARIKKMRDEGNQAPLEFDKDDDDAMDFVTATANIRAEIFSIPKKTRFDVKSMAGNIIPAIATTNAVIAGVVVIQAFKILNGELQTIRRVNLDYKARNSQLLYLETLSAPSPDCAVCQTINIPLKVHLSITLDDLLSTVVRRGVAESGLGLGEEVSISHGGKLLYDPDFEDNLPTSLGNLGIANGSFLNIVSDEQDEVLPPILLVIEESTSEGKDVTTAIECDITELAAFRKNDDDPRKRKRPAEDEGVQDPPKKMVKEENGDGNGVKIMDTSEPVVIDDGLETVSMGKKGRQKLQSSLNHLTTHVNYRQLQSQGSRKAEGPQVSVNERLTKLRAEQRRAESNERQKQGVPLNGEAMQSMAIVDGRTHYLAQHFGPPTGAPPIAPRSFIELSSGPSAPPSWSKRDKSDIKHHFTSILHTPRRCPLSLEYICIAKITAEVANTSSSASWRHLRYLPTHLKNVLLGMLSEKGIVDNDLFRLLYAQDSTSILIPNSKINLLAFTKTIWHLHTVQQKPPPANWEDWEEASDEDEYGSEPEEHPCILFSSDPDGHISDITTNLIPMRIREEDDIALYMSSIARILKGKSTRLHPNTYGISTPLTATLQHLDLSGLSTPWLDVPISILIVTSLPLLTTLSVTAALLPSDASRSLSVLSHNLTYLEEWHIGHNKGVDYSLMQDVNGLIDWRKDLPRLRRLCLGRKRCHAIADDAHERTDQLQAFQMFLDDIYLSRRLAERGLRMHPVEVLYVEDITEDVTINYLCCACKRVLESRNELATHFNIHIKTSDVPREDDNQNPVIFSNTKAFQVEKGGKIYTIDHPSYQTTSPYKAKWSQADLDRLKGRLHLKTSQSKTPGPPKSIIETFREQRLAQHSLKSLSSHPQSLALLREVLACPIAELLLKLWTAQAESINWDIQDRNFCKLLCLILTDFWGMCDHNTRVRDDERTPWVERTIPLFKYLGCSTKLVRFNWCETINEARKVTKSDRETWDLPSIRNSDGIGRSPSGREQIYMDLVELRSATVPYVWEDRHDWVRVFELLATLHIELLAQNTITEELKMQKSGLHPVLMPETVRFSRQDALIKHQRQHYPEVMPDMFQQGQMPQPVNSNEDTARIARTALKRPKDDNGATPSRKEPKVESNQNNEAGVEQSVPIPPDPARSNSTNERDSMLPTTLRDRDPSISSMHSSLSVVEGKDANGPLPPQSDPVHPYHTHSVVQPLPKPINADTTSPARRSPSPTAEDSEVPSKYRVAKHKLIYVTRENEMLIDEYQALKRRIRRLRVENGVLLDVLSHGGVGHGGRVQDETWRRANGSYITKYDWSDFLRTIDFHGVYGDNAGAWVIAPGKDYVNGDHLKQELTLHRESSTRDAVLLNMLHGTHFMTTPSSENFIPPGKMWGPWLVYLNNGSIDDAAERTRKEYQDWPYKGMNDSSYQSRGSVTGQLILDSGSPASGAAVFLGANGKLTSTTIADSNVLKSSTGTTVASGSTYQYTTYADDNGHFQFINVRTEQSYYLSAWSNDGEIGNVTTIYNGTMVNVRNNRETKLGTLEWQTQRRANIF
ncbi:hypothetical protein BZG36_02843 [Bifiguratus adelaidae]|uniref:Chloride channel protein n=1 Tax=Bifiguratus adelaidae TaxID=1938954 RepID=A0A261Y0X3_9FUNG|nr:hypothetical protein BZG36_02843 [Bifiguratus adelaidae]